MGFYYYNTAGQRLFAFEPPLEPPDAWVPGCEDEEEDDTPDWVYDDDHSYMIIGGKVIRYE